jgi:hypothetical protein
MAYGAKYVLTFSDVYQNGTSQYQAIIYKKDYTGTLYEISGSGTPVVIETDRSGSSQYRPIIATKATMNILLGSDSLKYWDTIPENWNDYTGLWDGSLFDLEEFITADIDTFLLEVKKGADVIWKGHYVFTSDLTIQEIEPISISLQFSDIQLLKVNRFYNFLAADTNKSVKYKSTDMRSILDVVMRATYYTGITNKARININTTFDFSGIPSQLQNTYNNGITTINSDLDLDEMLVQANAFLVSIGQYDTMYNVLAGICSQFGFVAYFSGSADGYVLNVRPYESLANSTTFAYNLYTISGFTSGEVVYSLTSTATHTDSNIELNTSNFKNIGRTQTIRFNYPDESVEIQNKSSINANLPNYNLSALSFIQGSPFNNTYGIPNWFLGNGTTPIFAPAAMAATDFGVTPFAMFTTNKATSTPNYVGTQINVKATANFGTTIFIDSEWVNLDSNNYVSMAFSALTDGRLKNYTAGQQTTHRPKPEVSLIMESRAGDIYYYNFTNGSFDFITFSTSLPGYTNYLMPMTLTQNFLGDSDRYFYEFNGKLEISDGAKVKLRFYKPYRSVAITNGWDAELALYLQYINLQSFKGISVPGAINNQRFVSTYEGVLSSDETLSLDSNLFMLDGANADRVMTINTTFLDREVPAMQFGNILGNQIVDRFFNPASSLYYEPYKVFGSSFISTDYIALQTYLLSICQSIQKNTCLNNVTIQGDYKSTFYPIGSKFTYDVIGYDSRSFALLDYRMDLKNGSQDSILYSSEFISDEGITDNFETIIN